MNRTSDFWAQVTVTMTAAQRLLWHISWSDEPEACDLFAWFVARWTLHRRYYFDPCGLTFWQMCNLAEYRPEGKTASGTPLYMAPEQVAEMCEASDAARRVVA